MKTPLLLCILLLTLSAAGFAFQWPVENPVLTATFCENRRNHFHGGIDLGGGEQEVHPIEDGEIIFYYTSDYRSSQLPTGLGNFLVIEHPRGIRSLYAHLARDPFDFVDYGVEKGDVLGIIGDTGASQGKHLHFEVADKELRQLANPMRLLPELPDRRAPSINDIRLVPGEYNGRRASEIPVSDAYTPKSGGSIAAGVWTVLMDVYDLSEYVSYFCPMSPYRIQVFLNGQMARSLVYDGLGENEARLEFIQATEVSFANFYLNDWLVNLGAITIPQGAVMLEFVASDYAGNEASRLVSLNASGR